MKEVYPSWQTLILTTLVLTFSFLMVYLKEGLSMTTVLTGILFLFLEIWLLLSTMGKIPLYRLR